jgi:hypothetical protein
MKDRLFGFLFFQFFLWFAVLFINVKPVFAATLLTADRLLQTPLTPTNIILSSIDPKDLGDSFTLFGIFTSSSNPVSGAQIVITIDGKFLGQTTTDSKGLFQYNFHQDLAAGSYVLTANYLGSRALAASSASSPLLIRPKEIVIQTIPAISGISFSMDGRQFYSDYQGKASIFISKSGLYHLDVQTDLYSNPAQRITFGRWQDEIYQPSRDLQVPGPVDVLQIGFDVYHQVNQNFVDLDGNAFDTNRIKSITIKSAQGDIFNYQAGQQIWVPASRVNRRSTGLEVTQLLYSVINVTVDGSNVVNKAQQRFYSGADEIWKISLILYSLEVIAKDALIGSPVGESLTLMYPDGTSESFPLDQSGAAKLPSLARGIYKIKLTGTKGIDTIIPVALSRNQVINENVITYLDLGIVFGFVFLIAIGLIFVGRPWLLFPRSRSMINRKEISPKEDPVYIHDN